MPAESKRAMKAPSLHIGMILGLLGGSAWSQGLPDEVRDLLASAAPPGATWALLAEDLGSGEILLEYNADQWMAPASVAKLFSGAAALHRLGSNHRFKTRVYAFGSLDDNGYLDGTLVVQAVGDPNLSGRRQGERLAFANIDHTYSQYSDEADVVAVDPLEGVDDLARQVSESGIQWVRDVIIDDRAFGREISLSPVVVNDNLVDFIVQPSVQPGEYASVHMRPPCALVQLDARVNTVATSGRREVIIQRVGEWRFCLLGGVSANGPSVVKSAAVEDPASFLRSLFIERLREHGVRGPASPLAENERDELPTPGEYETARVVATRESAPFAEALKVILKTSHNLHARMLPTLLARNAGKPSSEGMFEIAVALNELGVHSGFTFASGHGDGSGQANSVTSRATLLLLKAMERHDEAAAFRDAMPVLGEDGTLTNSGVDGPAKGRVLAKTGTQIYESGTGKEILLGSKALAGYLTTLEGRRIAFAFFLNRVPVGREGIHRAQAGLVSVCEWLVRTPRPKSK